MIKVISIFNNKGGVGKTNITWNLGHELAKMNMKVLMIDFDPQCNLSLAVLGETQFANILSKRETIRAYFQPLSQQISGERAFVHYPIYCPNKSLGLIAGDFWLNSYADTLNVGNDLLSGYGIAKFVSLRRLIDDCGLHAGFMDIDYVLIDLPPSFSTIVRSAMYSSDYYIVPCTSDTFCAYCLGLIGNMLPIFVRDWNDGLIRFRQYNPGINTFNYYGEPKFAGWIFNGFDEQKQRFSDDDSKVLVRADSTHHDRIAEAVSNDLITSLKSNIKSYQPIYTGHSNNMEIGQIADLNVLIQNSIWQSVPITELKSVKQLSLLGGRTNWAANQIKQIDRVSGKITELANNVSRL